MAGTQIVHHDVARVVGLSHHPKTLRKGKHGRAAARGHRQGIEDHDSSTCVHVVNSTK